MISSKSMISFLFANFLQAIKTNLFINYEEVPCTPRDLEKCISRSSVHKCCRVLIGH